MVLFALFLTAMLAGVGMAVDGGNMYAQRRAAQNAADAGALAGLADLARAVSGSTITSANVDTDVTSNASANAGTTIGETTVTTTWNFIDNAGTNLGTTLNTGTNTGVSVRVQKTFPTFFLQILPTLQSLTVAGTARAQLQVVAGGSGPFLVCATGISENADPIQLFNITPNPPQINPLAVWRTPGPGLNTPTPPVLLVHESQLDLDGGNCGYGSQFKGTTDQVSPQCSSVPCWMEGNNGNTNNPLRVTLAGVTNCTIALLDAGTTCMTVLPIITPDSIASAVCPGAAPSDPSTTPVCVKTFGVFEIMGPSSPPSNCNSNCHKAKLKGAAVVSDPVAGVPYTPGAGGPLIVRLSQ
jgi:Flp pilus assembly protein TadG